MASKISQAAQIVNKVAKVANEKYGTEFSMIREGYNIKDFGDDFIRQPIKNQNAFNDVLVDLILAQIFANKRSFNSYFKKLRKGETNGQIQLIAQDLIEAKVYSPDADSEDYFEDAKQRIDTQYLYNVLQLKYAVSINRTATISAFLSDGAFMDYLDAAITNMFNSAENDDIRLTKSLIENAIENGNVYIQTSPTPTDQSSSLAFTQIIKEKAGDMAIEMFNDYNAGHFHTVTPKDEGLLLTTTKVASVADVYSLSFMFNKQLADLREDGLFMEMSSRGLSDGRVYAVYMDTDALQIRNFIGFPISTMKFFENTLTEKRWLHTKVMYNLNYFANMMAFADPSDVGITAATLKTRSGSVNVNKGEKLQVLVDTITAEDGKLADKFGTFEIENATDSETRIDAKSGYMVIGKNESGATNKIKVKWTSHLNSSVVAELELTING